MAFKMNPKSPALKSMSRYATPQAIKPAVTSPAKQTASQKKNLPEAIVKAIAAKSPAKQVGKDAGETAAFEKSKAIELRMEKKMEKATGNKKKQARIANRTNKKMARKVPRAKRRADNKGYDMENFDGTTTRLKGKNEKSSKSPAKQKNNTAKRKAEGVDPTKWVAGSTVNLVPSKKTLATRKITKPNNAVKKVVKKVVKKAVKKKVLKPTPFPTSSFGEDANFPTPPENKKKKPAKKNPNNRLGVHSVTSPAKQKVNRNDGVQVKEVPKVVGEEVKKATDFVGKEAKKVSKWGKKLFKKIGNIKLTKTKKEKLKKAEEKVSKLKTKTKQ